MHKYTDIKSVNQKVDYAYIQHRKVTWKDNIYGLFV